jgi:type II secretory pathway component GspD/PulD (secretin)
MKKKTFIWVLGLNLGLLLQVHAEEIQTNAPPVSPAPPIAVEAPAPEPPATATPMPPVSGDESPIDLAAQPAAAETDLPPAGEIIPVVDVQDADLLAVIRMLARQAGINFQFDPKVTSSVGEGPDGKPAMPSKVSFRLENVTAQQVLLSVLQNYDLVMTMDSKTKIARITHKQPGAPEPLKSKVIQLNFSNPTNMSVLVKAVFSDRRSLAIADVRTSQLVLLATERELEEAEKLITQLDASTRQVLIEGRIFETIQSPTSIKGIDWSGTLEAQKVMFGNGVLNPSSLYDYTSAATRSIQSGLTAPTTLPSDRVIPGTAGTTVNQSSQSATALSVKSFAGPSGMAYNTMNGFTPSIGFLSADGVSAVISFLNKQADTELLATPRTVTLDNETATLEITKAYPIFQITPGSANSPAGSQVEYTNLGTILTVTPRISGNSNVTLKVVPEVSNIEAKDTQTINGQINSANVYAIRKMQTQVLIPSGGTLVMGGLMNDFKSKQYTKVPILGDIPGLGLAFRHESKMRQKQNLLVFVTPTILRDVDFQRNPSSDFLKTDPKASLGPDESSWDSGSPHDWKKSQTNSTKKPKPQQTPQP